MDEREKDKAVLAAATERPWLWWTSNSHRRLRRSDGGPDIAYGTKQTDGCDDIVISERDMAAMETAVNRIEAYVADAEEMERRIEALEYAAAEHEAGRLRPESWASLPEPVKAALDAAQAASLRTAVRILRGGQ